MRLPVLCIALVVLVASAAPAHADTYSPGPAILMVPASAIAVIANTIMMTEGHPGYAMGIAGAGVGGLTLLAMAADDDHGDTAYALAGGMALGTGLMAIWYRRSLNGEVARVTIVPCNARGGSPAVALAIRP